MGEIEITAGSKAGAYLGADGTFPATLTGVTDRGQGGTKAEGAPPFKSKDPTRPDYYLREWEFAIEGAPPEGCLVWASTSLNASPKSKAFGYITALFGKAPPVGTKLDIERHLIGRMCLVTVHRDDQGFMVVDQLTPMPTVTPQARPSAPAPAPAPAPTGALRQQVDATAPF